MLGPPNDIALTATSGNTVAQQLLPEGKLGIDLDGSWLSSNWGPSGAKPWPQWKTVLGQAKTPTEFGQAPHYVTLSGGWAYSISARSKNKDAAWTVLKAANSKDMLAYYDTNVANITPRKDVVDTKAYSSVPLNPFFTSLLSFAQFRPGFPAYPKISVEIDRAMEAVMTGTSPQAALSTYAQKVTAIAGASNVEKLP